MSLPGCRFMASISRGSNSWNRRELLHVTLFLVLENTTFFAALIQTAMARISTDDRPGLWGSGDVPEASRAFGQNDSNISYVRRPNRIVPGSGPVPRAAWRSAPAITERSNSGSGTTQ